MKKLFKNVLALTLSIVLIASSLMTGLVTLAESTILSYYGTEADGFDAAGVTAEYKLKPADKAYNLDFEQGFKFWSGRNDGSYQKPYASDVADLITATGGNKYLKIKSPYVTNVRSAVFEVSGVNVGDDIRVMFDTKGTGFDKIRIKMLQVALKDGATYDATTGLSDSSTMAKEYILVGTGGASPVSICKYQINEESGWTTYLGNRNQSVQAPPEDSDGKIYLHLTLTCGDAGVSSGDAVDAAIDNIRIIKNVDGVYYDVFTGAEINENTPPASGYGGDNNQGGGTTPPATEDDTTPAADYYGTEADGFNSLNSSWPQKLKPVEGIKNLNFSKGFVYWSGRNANEGGGGTLASTSFKLVDSGTNKYITIRDNGYVDNMRTALFKVDGVEVGDKIVAIYFANGADAEKLRVVVLQDYIRKVTYDATTGLNNTATNASPGGETQLTAAETAPTKFQFQADNTNWTTYIAPNSAVVVDPTTTSSKTAPTANIYLQVMITKASGVNVGDMLDVAIDNIILAKEVDGVYYDLASGDIILQETIDNMAPPTLEAEPEEKPEEEEEEEEDDTLPPAAYYGTEENGFSSATNASFNLKPVKGFKNLDFTNGFVYWSGRNGGASEPYASDCFDLVTEGDNKYVKVKDSGWVVSMRTAIFSVSGLTAGDKLTVLYDVKGKDGDTFHIKLSQFIFKTDVTYDETTGQASGSPLATGEGERVIVGSGIAADDFKWNLGEMGWTTRIGATNLTVKAPSSGQSKKYYFQLTITSDAGGAQAGDKLDAAIDNLRVVKIVGNNYYDITTGEQITNPSNTPAASADALAWLVSVILAEETNNRNADFNKDNAVNLLDVVYLKRKLAAIADGTAPIESPMFEPRTEDVYSGKMVSYKISNSEGWYFTPKEEGTYKTIILMHGQGPGTNFRERLLSTFNNWVKAGYIEPMVVVIPYIRPDYGPGSATNAWDMDDFMTYIKDTNGTRFNALLTSIENGTLSSKIDTSKKPFVAGFSMGGMSALDAGVKYRDRISQIGALSPAKAFYLENASLGPCYSDPEAIQFSTALDAKVFLIAGLAEVGGEGEPQFIESIRRYEKAIAVNNADILVKYEAPKSWGGHAWALSQKEIFMFLNLVLYNRLPTEEYVENSCDPDNYKVPTIVSDPAKEHA